MTKTCFTSSGRNITVLQYKAKCSPDEHVEYHIRLFDNMKDAKEYLNIIVGDRLIWAGFSSECILKAESVEQTEHS